MKTIMAKNIAQDLSSKRQFHWTTKVSNEDDVYHEEEEDINQTSFRPHEEVLTKSGPDQNIDAKMFVSPGLTSAAEKPALKTIDAQEEVEKKAGNSIRGNQDHSSPTTRKKLQAIAVSRLRSVLMAFNRNRAGAGSFQQGLGSRVIGTLFGHRRGHVHFAFQKEPTSEPAFLIELATPISGLVKEMASGLVRIALECDRGEEKKTGSGPRLLEEPVWRTYCNGKKCGFATRRECGAKEWKILKAVEPISMGAGVLPGNEDGGDSGELMYMRAKFERVVGSRDSEAFYMMNPDSNGAPELSIYLLRV